MSQRLIQFVKSVPDANAFVTDPSSLYLYRLKIEEGIIWISRDWI